MEMRSSIPSRSRAAYKQWTRSVFIRYFLVVMLGFTVLGIGAVSPPVSGLAISSEINIKSSEVPDIYLSDPDVPDMDLLTNEGRTVRWGACDPSRDDIDPKIRCGLFEVPISWDRPLGPSFDARVYMQQTAATTTSSKAPVPFLVFPSGPGQTADIGFSTVASLAPGSTIVGMDPRGVGESGRLTCNTKTFITLPTVMPTSKAQFTSALARSREFAQTCRTDPPELINHLDAYSNARDAQSLRLALGLDRVNIYGGSYGTILAARYLEIDGAAVSASVLEGVLDPTMSIRDFQATASAGLERLFERLMTWCRTDANCRKSGNSVQRVFNEAKGVARSGGVSGGTVFGRPWDSAAVTQYFELSAIDGDFAATYKGLVALSSGKPPEGAVGVSSRLPRRVAVPDVIVCFDFGLGNRRWRERQKIAQASREAAPRVHYSTNAASYMALCAGMPKPHPIARSAVTSHSAAPSLLLSCDVDAVTPRTWARRVAGQLGTLGINVVAPCIGHGLALEDPEVRSTVIEYLTKWGKS